MYSMWMMVWVACRTAEPVEVEEVLEAPPIAVRVAPEPVVQVVAGREPIVGAATATRWGTDAPPCTGRCVALETRVQASSERKVDGRIYAEHFAADEDLATAWCGETAVGQKVSMGMGRARTVRRVLLAGWDGEGAALAEVDLVTDRGDRLAVMLDAPNGKWPGLGNQPPAIDVLFEDVQFVQVEVRAVHGDGPACISEVLLLGE